MTRREVSLVGVCVSMILIVAIILLLYQGHVLTEQLAKARADLTGSRLRNDQLSAMAIESQRPVKSCPEPTSAHTAPICPAPGKRTLEHVRTDWGIAGRLSCSASP